MPQSVISVLLEPVSGLQVGGFLISSMLFVVIWDGLYEIIHSCVPRVKILKFYVDISIFCLIQLLLHELVVTVQSVSRVEGSDELLHDRISLSY